MSDQIAVAKLNQQTAASGVLIKLVLFSVALAVIPLSSYFGSLKYLWDGNPTYSAITAVIAANVVLVAYIIMSLLEDQSPHARRQDGKDGVVSNKETKKDI